MGADAYPVLILGIAVEKAELVLGSTRGTTCPRHFVPNGANFCPTCGTPITIGRDEWRFPVAEKRVAPADMGKWVADVTVTYGPGGTRVEDARLRGAEDDDLDDDVEDEDEDEAISWKPAAISWEDVINTPPSEAYAIGDLSVVHIAGDTYLGRVWTRAGRDPVAVTPLDIAAATVKVQESIQRLGFYRPICLFAITAWDY